MINEIKRFFHKNLAKHFYSIIKPLQPILNFKKRTFFDKFKVKTTEGHTFYLYNNAFWLETNLFWDGFENSDWEKKTRTIWKQLANNSKVIFDVGANTGIFSVLAKANNPKSTVFAFEPQPNIFKILKKNNSINHYNINCIPLAVSDSIGRFPFYNMGQLAFETDNTTIGSLNKNWISENRNSIEVDVVTLDEFIRQNNIEKVDLIKIDVETFEFQVLLGYRAHLYRHLPIIILEIQNNSESEKILGIIDDNIYRKYWINEGLGLIETDSLNEKGDSQNWNYLLCPRQKVEMIKEFIASKP